MGSELVNLALSAFALSIGSLVLFVLGGIRSDLGEVRTSQGLISERVSKIEGKLKI